VYIIFTLSHPAASIVYSAKSVRICIWLNMSVLASIPIHKHGQKWPLWHLKVKTSVKKEYCTAREIMTITDNLNITRVLKFSSL
jgi:hypothetical protein